ncbi:MAG: type IV pilus modification protein PilV [Polaromonas sp.]|uniref:type IV pilus modification protein PilV n=1 Tax=Polaromonas sp. TaxID=1869339 RepID=UPI00248A17B3|nr:type IV pilus modification protein PilV [Polaromonas sp.]MDI1239520.1 type IV pilus modification protein PilV [Polaromonas sp.]
MSVMNSQRGAGLIEALVAILVLSIGLLGMVGMQTASIKYEQTGWVRSALSSNISSLADRIRANASADENAYTFSRTYAAERASIEATPLPNTYLSPAKDCNAEACTNAELAAYDLAVWRSDLNQQLPGAVGFVTPTGVKGVDLRFGVTVAWFNKDNLDGTNLRQPEICPVPAVGTTGIAARNCCPASVGTAAALAGIQCVNLEIIP